MTDAEKHLLEVFLAYNPSPRAGELLSCGAGSDWREVKRAKDAVIAERLDHELPGFRDEYKGLIRQQRLAQRATQEYSRKLERYGVETDGEQGLTFVLWKELDAEMGLR